MSRRSNQLARMGAVLRAARLHRRLRLVDVAPAVGVSLSVLHGYESGRLEPPALRLFAHARVLGVDLDRLASRSARGRLPKAA